MKVGFLLAALAAAAMGACLIAPGVASASTDSAFMWNNDQAGGILCAAPQARLAGWAVIMVSPNTCATNNPASTWFFPAKGATGQIRLAGTGLCLQQDDQDSPNIVLAKCGLPDGQGGAAEEWISHLNSDSGDAVYYAFQNEYTKGCLNDDYYVKSMNVADCNDATDQIWEFPF